MTINRALDQLLLNETPNLAQQDLKFSLTKFKMEFGGKTMIENSQEIQNIIEYGNKEGVEEI